VERLVEDRPDLAPLDRLLLDRVDEAEPLLAAEEPLAPAELLARLPLARAAADLERPPGFDALDRPLDERPPLALDLDDPPLPEELSSSPPQRPDMTRCAASATASAINEPSFVALDTAAVAAWLAVSAASSPASRILRRAAGLALIAAAAAASPAASISRLSATLASLSTVLSFEPEDDLLEEDLLPDFAIPLLPLSKHRHSKAVTVPYRISESSCSTGLIGRGSAIVQRFLPKRD